MNNEHEIKYPNLRAEMARKGITQTMIAKLLGVSDPTIFRKFSGRTDWTLGEIEAICEYLQKDYYHLFIDKD